MIFRRIRLTNLLAYRKADLNLAGASAERNIVLIQGRNGYGKTSFINGVKLLFAGPNRDMCRAVQEGRELKPRQYVLGLGEDWMGILNRRARRAGEGTCEVRAIWDEGRVEVEAARRWELGSSDYSETVEVDIRGDSPRHLEGDEAQQFLGERLPEDFLPFFFFDGEQIQRLAEANPSYRQHQIERLLNISHIDTIVEHLGKVARGLRDQAMEAAEKAKLAELEGDLALLDARKQAEEERRAVLERERDDLERLIREEEHFLEGRRVANLAEEERHLTAERDRLSEDLERAQASVAEALPLSAPLLVNPALVDKAAGEVRGLVESEAAVQSTTLQSVLRNLPEDLFDKPPHSRPPLTEAQIRFYKHRLESLLSAYIPDPELVVDEMDVHLHPKWQHNLLNMFKQMVRDHAGLTIVTSTHARELIPAFGHDIPERGLRKAGHIIEEGLG